MVQQGGVPFLRPHNLARISTEFQFNNKCEIEFILLLAAYNIRHFLFASFQSTIMYPPLVIQYKFMSPMSNIFLGQKRIAWLTISSVAKV